MGVKIRTLVLEANGFGWQRVLIDTFVRSILGIRDINYLPKPLQGNRFARHALKFKYDGLSYIIDWRDAICDSADLDVTLCNINDLTSYMKWMKAINGFELVIILHSAAGDDMTILLKTAKWFLERKGKLVVFIGNEYDLMADKISFLRQTHAEFVCSQLPIQTAKWLYAECQDTQVLEMPHALNPKLYRPGEEKKRHTDLGFRGMAYPIFIGDIERQKMLDYFLIHGKALGLNVDIRYERLNRDDWAAYLQTCWGIVGAESGTYFLDRQGLSIYRAKQYLRKHPHAKLVEILAQFSEPQGFYRSGKAISSRHFEPIGTKTCQLLLEGEYNGILQPDIHYINIKKDFSNMGEAVDRFQDPDFRKTLVDQTYEYVMSKHTYNHRIEKLMNNLQAAPAKS